MATIRFADKTLTSTLADADIFILTQNATNEDRRVVASVLAEFVRQYSGDGTYAKPFRIDSIRLWRHADGHLMKKDGSDPGNDGDGYMLQEGSLS